MSRRGRAGLRCPECRLLQPLCICAELPTLPTRTRVVVLLHQLEARKTTNTGRLAHRCLPNSELHLRGHLSEQGARETLDDDTRRVPPWLSAAARPLLLFPDADAQTLDDSFAERASEPGQEVTLIVPDGTWSQASRARKRLMGLDAIPCVTVRPEGPSSYRLRQAPRAGQLSTLEAIAHALGVLEGEAVKRALLSIHRLAVERTLFSKGRLAAADVWGGLPPAVEPRRD